MYFNELLAKKCTDFLKKLQIDFEEGPFPSLQRQTPQRGVPRQRLKGAQERAGLFTSSSSHSPSLLQHAHLRVPPRRRGNPRRRPRRLWFRCRPRSPVDLEQPRCQLRHGPADAVPLGGQVERAPPASCGRCSGWPPARQGPRPYHVPAQRDAGERASRGEDRRRSFAHWSPTLSRNSKS